VRNALVAALIACSNTSLKTNARRFLQGLSSDELQFIAEYLGACILESTEPCHGSRAKTMGEFNYCPQTPDQDHKMIMLLEYLRRSGLPVDARA
jgi:hypothetical protein